MAAFDKFINSIIADGNDGKAFEKFCKHFLETSPEYAHQFEKVWLWDDWPNRWSRDKGIDLVAKYKGRDTYCAIQAKCYAAHNTVPYNEVTNFLADSSRAEIEDRILMMSTNKLNEKTSKEVISGQEKQVTILDRDYFENKAKFDYPAHISELGKAKAKPPATPRKHQITAINDVEKGLQENDRGQLIMACGTGKTFTTLWIKERLKANTVLVLLPSLSLLSQTMREWVWGANERFEALAVCSDPTVGKSKNSDEDISTAEVGKVTWHVDEIETFLRSSKPKVIFCTYQSSELIQLAQEDETIPQFDLVVCDEAHRCAGKANAGFATVLHEEKIRAKKRLFTTATPRYYGKSVQSAAEGRGVEVIGMDDEAKFGPVVHKLTFGQAIEMDMLTDYQVVVVGVDEPMVREWIAEAEIVSYGDENHTDARTLASKIAVLKAIKDYDLKRVISFHTNIKRAKKFASDVFDVAALIDVEQRPSGKIWSQHVDGTMSAGKRRDLINGLKELDGHEIGLLTNARCLSEGVDVPSLDGVAFVDPRGSQVDIIQAVGRAIRKSDNKTKGTIVLPVFLEAGDDPDTVIDATNFKPVWDVLKALRAHDEVLADTLDVYRTNMGLGVSRKSDRIEKIIFDLPRHIDDGFSNALTTQIVQHSTDSWQFCFGLYSHYITENRTVKIDNLYKTNDGFALGAWVNAQRRYYKTGELSQSRIDKLEDLSGWSWDPFEDAWNSAFEIFKEYYNANQTTVIGKDVFVNGFGLGSWVHTQRQNKKKLSGDKVSKLEGLTGWMWNPRQDAWVMNLTKLKQFVAENNRIPIRGEQSEDGTKIGDWAVKQRNRRNELPTERKRSLESIPKWVWNVDTELWKRNYDALFLYIKENGWANFKQTTQSPNGLRLGAWVTAQRVNFKKKKLSDERIKSLEEISGWVWDKAAYEWENGYTHLNKFVERYGHARVQRGTVFNGFKLANWVTQQRVAKSTLSKYKIDKLEALSGWTWHVLQDDWDKHFRELEQYYLKNGTCKVSYNFRSASGFNLAQWVERQINNKHNLTKEQLDEFDKLPNFWADNIKVDEWELKFRALVSFTDKYGSARPSNTYVDENGITLGSWVAGQRARYRKTVLEQEKIKKLEGLNGWVWDSLEAQWQETYERLLKEVERRGKAAIPQNYVDEAGIKLGSWINSQRQRYRKNKLDQHRVKLMEQIPGFAWDPHEALWEEGFSELLVYVSENGSADVPSNFICTNGYRLGQWVHVQRGNRKSISNERKIRLENLPSWLWTKV